MLVKELNKEERKSLYKHNLSKDFNKSELKPLSMIEKLIDEKVYMCLGFFERDILLGYAYLVLPRCEKVLLVDYLAVCEDRRSRGFGSEFLNELKEKFKESHLSLIAEVEDPEYSNSEQDKLNRKRRIEFYKRNHFKVSGVSSKVTADRYKIIALDLQKELRDVEILKSIMSVYKTIFDKSFYENHIRVYKK